MSEDEHSTAQGEAVSERSQAVLAVELFLVAITAELVALQLSPELASGASPLASAMLDLTLGAVPLGVWVASRWIPARGRRLLHPLATVTAAAVILIGGLTVTAVLAQRRRDGVEREARAQFDRSVERVKGALSARIIEPTQALLRVHDAITAAPNPVGSEALRRQAEALESVRELRGVRGVGFVDRVRRDQLHALDRSAEESGEPPRSTTEATFVVRQVEPRALNWSEHGADFGADPLMRRALERAIDTGEPTLGRKTLSPHHENRGLYRLFVPIYREGEPRVTPSERQRALAFVVYAPVALDEVLDGVARTESTGLSYALFDSASSVAKPIFVIDPSSPTSSTDQDWPISVEVPIVLAGRALTLRATSTPQFQRSIDLDAPAWLWVVGTMISGCCALAVFRVAPTIHLARPMAPGAMHWEEDDSTPPSDVVSGLEERITWVSGRFSNRAPTIPSDRVTMPAPRS